ncbi:MAG: DNA topoisomerase IV subunit A [Chlamydiia bacterium]
MATDDMKHQMQDNFLRYAAYVILDRAIPDVADGLKPVQRRLLYTLHRMDSGRFHKVSTVVGQTMSLHPHGDAAINEALVNLSQKGLLLDEQGNFGNPLTGDPAAAPRYIETRLAGLARDTLFNDEITPFVPSYDGRAQEPVLLPAKIPLLLMLGIEGIAVGMSTRIFPHNFVELLNAQIAILEKKPFELIPDFPSGGFVDASDYARGRGKLRLRARVTARDDKTVVIDQICYGTTTESLIHSIDEAAKRGKIKIESIHDYTAEDVHIEIKLPRGQHADELIQPLYAFTDCQVVLHGHCLAIRDQLPWDTDVHAILEDSTERLQVHLQKELELERRQLLEKIFERQLERIFIEEKVYKALEEAISEEEIDRRVARGLFPFHGELIRPPVDADRKRLLQIPIRRISRFDTDRNRREIEEMQKRIGVIEIDLGRIPKVAIQFIKGILKKYGGHFERRTQIEVIGEVDRKALETKTIQIGYDAETGFLGTQVKGPFTWTCTNRDKVLLFHPDGTYRIIPIPEKLFIEQPVLHVGTADRQTVFGAVYKNSQGLFGKRFVVDSFIMEKSYQFVEPEEELLLFIDKPETVVVVKLAPAARQRVDELEVAMDEIRVKGVSAKGIRLTDKKVKSVAEAGSKPSKR